MSKVTIRNFIIALILVIFASSLFGFIIYSVFAQGAQLNTQIESLQADRAREVSYYKLQRLTEETAADREQLKSYYLLQESDSIDFLNRVEGLAPKAGVIIKTNNLELITKEDRSEWIKVDFSFAGSRDRVQKFVQILETLPYVLQVISVDMKALSSTEWGADLTMEVQVLAYDE